MDGTGRADFAAELARRRAETGLSLADVASAAHVARGYVHHVEHGHRWPSRTVARALDAAVGANGALVASWQDVVHNTGKPSARPAPAVLPVIEPLSAPAGAGYVPADVETLRAMAHAFHTADRQVGGGRLYPGLLRFLHTEIAPALIGPRGADSGELFAAAASLTEIAGWMAHDSGADDAARNHFGRAYRLATAAGCDALAGNVCASMAHLAAQLGRSADAVRIVEVGLDRTAAAALDTAERSLTRATGTEPTEWIARFDEGALAGEVALCLLQIGDLVAAERAARRVIELRDGDRGAIPRVRPADAGPVLLRAGRPDEAALLGRAMCEVVPSLTSTRVRSRLAGLGDALRPHRATTGVTDFLDQLAALPACTTANSEPTWPV